MILVARNQQDGTDVAIGKHSPSRNFSSILNIEAPQNVHRRAEGNQRVQVDDRAFVLPKKPVQVVTVVVKGNSYDLTVRINALSFALRISPNSPEIRHYAAAPEKCVADQITCSRGVPDNLSSIVYPVWVAESASQWAQVLQSSRLAPQERMYDQVSRQVRGADDLTTVINSTKYVANKRA